MARSIHPDVKAFVEAGGVIGIEDREHLPFRFGELPTVRRHYKTGDYSFYDRDRDYSDVAAIERKSLVDFVQSLTHGRDRFEAEMERMAPLERKLILVEASYSDIVNHWYPTQAGPTAIIGSIAAIHARWGVPTLFGESREGAEYLARIWILKTHKRLRAARAEAA